MRYIPPFETVKQFLKLAKIRGETVVSMKYEEAQSMIRALLSAFDVDEPWYLEQNPDSPPASRTVRFVPLGNTSSITGISKGGRHFR